MQTSVQIVLIVVLGSILSSCNGDPFWRSYSNNGPLSALYDENHRTLEVSYSPSDSMSSALADQKRLFACIVIATSCGYEVRRWPMEARSNDDVLIAEFPLPNNLLGVLTSVAPEGAWMGVGMPKVVTIATQGGVPVSGAIPFIMSQASDYNIALRLFQYDDERYGTSNQDRWIVRTLGELASGASADSIKSRIDSLIDFANSHDAEQQVAALHLCKSAVHSFDKEWDSVLGDLSLYCHSVTGKDACIDFFDLMSLETIVDQLSNQGKRNTMGLVQDPSDIDSVISKLCQLAIETKNGRLSARLLRYAMGSSNNITSSRRTILSELADSISFRLQGGDFYDLVYFGGNDIVATLVQFYSNGQDDAKLIQLMNAVDPKFDSLSEWQSESPLLPARTSSVSAQRMSNVARLCESLARSGRSREACSIFTSFKARYPSEANRHLNVLGWLWVSANEVDSAADVLVDIDRIGRSDKKLLDTVLVLLRHHNISVQDMEGIKRITTGRTSTVSRKLSPVTITSLQGDVVTTQKLHDTVLCVVFTTSSCGPCRLHTPKTLEILSKIKSRVPSKVVVMIPPDDIEMREQINQGSMTVLYYPYLFDWYFVDSYPKLLIVRNNQILFESDDLFEPTVEAAVLVAEKPVVDR